MSSDFECSKPSFLSEDTELALEGDVQAFLRLFPLEPALSRPLAQVSNYHSQDFQDAEDFTSASLPLLSTIPQHPLHEVIAPDDTS